MLVTIEYSLGFTSWLFKRMRVELCIYMLLQMCLTVLTYKICLRLKIVSQSIPYHDNGLIQCYDSAVAAEWASCTETWIILIPSACIFSLCTAINLTIFFHILRKHTSLHRLVRPMSSARSPTHSSLSSSLSGGSLSGFPEEDLRSEGNNNSGFYPVRLGQCFEGGRYCVVRKLGWGHYSSVWLARDKE